jgi:hypothetical protein
MRKLYSLVVASALLAAGCGTVQGSQVPGGQPLAVSGSQSVRAASPNKAATGQDKAAGGGYVVGEGVRTKYAWVRLRQDTYFIRPGNQVRLWLDISASKPIRSFDADWYATEGRLYRWRTDNVWDWNYWTAPDREGSYWLRLNVNIQYANGTLDREWVNDYLRVSK